MAKPKVSVAAPGNFTQISTESQQQIIALLASSVSMFGTTYNIRDRMRDLDRAYLRQTDKTVATAVAKAQNKTDPTKFQNIIVPIVKPQVEQAVAKLSSIFLSGSPIFGVSSAPPYQEAAMQMESILKDQEERGGWASQLQSCFRDGKKYNLMGVEVTWRKEDLPKVISDIGAENMAKLQPDSIWEGNALRRLDLYNSFWDLRCAPNKVHEEGDFAGYNELVSRNTLLRRMWKLGNTQMNRKAAMESKMTFTGNSGSGVASYHIPEINTSAVVSQSSSEFNWSAWMSGTRNTESSVRHSDTYVLTTFYARILPADFGLSVPSPKTPAVWRFIVVNGQHIIYAEALRNLHDYLPIIFSPMDCADLGYQETGLAEEMKPFQDLASANANGGIHAMKRAVNDRLIYDPSKIDKSAMENPNGQSRIPVKPAAYGQPLSQVVYQMPFVDTVSGNSMQAVAQVNAFANQASGQNAADQGQFVKGNKTLHEYADVMNNGNGRNVNTAVNVEHNFMGPIKAILRLNILQFQRSDSVYNPSTEQYVTIDPVALRQAEFKFKMSDGLSPADKVMNADAFGVAFQMIATSPQLQARYDLGALATYMLNQQRADVSPFQKSEAQVAYEQAANQWQQLAMMLAEKGGNLNGLPPQPKPADFGWDPNQPKQSVPTSDPTGKPAIMSQVAQISSAQQPNQNPNSGQPQPTM